MIIDTKFNLKQRVMAQIFPGKFEWCDIMAIYITNDGIFYAMLNGLIIPEYCIFIDKETTVKWAEVKFKKDQTSFEFKCTSTDDKVIVEQLK